MNTTKKIFLFFILLGITQLFSTCSKKMFSKITYEGIVYDTIGGTPVMGVNVRLDACSSNAGVTQCHFYEVGNSTTDPNGHFKIEEKEARSNRYAISFGTKSLPWAFSYNKNDLKDIKCTILYLR